MSSFFDDVQPTASGSVAATSHRQIRLLPNRFIISPYVSIAVADLSPAGIIPVRPRFYVESAGHFNARMSISSPWRGWRNSAQVVMGAFIVRLIDQGAAPL